MTCYYHLTTETNPYRNLALEELLLRTIGPKEVLLYLWQNENTVVIGRNQNAWQECRLDAFSAQSGRLARRLSGGGAVFHDMGNQNFTFLADNARYDLQKQTEVIRLAAKSFGIDAVRSGRNDILASGRKFSGNAFHRTKKASLHHGTILISSDLSKLGEYLAPSPEKLAAKGVESVRARVMNLCELNEEVTPEKMRQALLEAFAAVYRVQPVPFPKERIEQAGLERLTTHYSSEEWRLGRLSPFSYEMRHRFSFGELELLLEVRDGLVTDAKAYSDAMDADWIEGLGIALIGRPFQGEALAQAIPACVSAGDRQEVADYLRRGL